MVSIAKLPGAKPKALSANDQCPKCQRFALAVVPAEDGHMGQFVDKFVRCLLCGHCGPLGGIRVVK